MIEQISYRGWENVYRISNATVELVVLADVGPRILVVSASSEAKIFFTKLKSRPA